MAATARSKYALDHARPARLFKRKKARLISSFIEHALPRLEDKRYQVQIDQVFRLEEVNAAVARMESNETLGKLVLSVSGHGPPGSRGLGFVYVGGCPSERWAFDMLWQET